MSAENKSLDIFKFAGMVCLACSLVVSVSAVALRGLQTQNANNEMKINILRAAGLAGADEKLSAAKIDEKFKEVVPVVVELATGELDKSKNPLEYKMYAAAQNNQDGRALSEDPTNIKRIAKHGSAYVLLKGEDIDRLILPIQGYGLWSTMYGFTALTFKNEQPEIAGITFYQQAETAGLGSRITEPAWQSKFEGRLPYDSNGKPQLEIVKTKSSYDDNQVEAIAGATLTSKGVENMMNFWLGEQGYQPFVERIVGGEIDAQALRDASQAAAAQDQ